jgi:hypothetical protein
MNRVGTREEWLAARVELLERGKELTRRSDQRARDDGRGTSRSDGLGHSLVGIRERVKIFPGRDECGRGAGGRLRPPHAPSRR